MADKTAKVNHGGLPKPVKVVETGDVFPSRKQAAQELGLTTSDVYTAIKTGSSINGLHLLDASDGQEDEDAASVEPPSVLSVLSLQLGVKDRQIASLQATVSSLIKQLDAKERKIGTLTSELSSLRKHIEHLDASLEYWQTAMKHCEEAADAKIASVISQYKQRPRSRFDGVQRLLSAKQNTAQKE